MPEVTVVDVNELPFEEVRRGRVHMIRRKRLPLTTGVPGLTMEFSYSIVPVGYFTPRHRHNFDQIRYTLSGNQSTGHGDLAPGEVGYFPEGAHYGPQEQKDECHTLVLQGQGASGEHMLSNEEMNETYTKMIGEGAVFENGIFKGRKPDGGRINKDSYEAIWEEREGRDLYFPPPRYRTPAMMIPDRYRWVPDRARPGVETKHLGTFTEYRTGIGFMRLLPGATLAAGRQVDAELRYIVEGSARYAGRDWPTGTYFYLPPDAETAALSSSAGASFFIISLPMIAELAARRPVARAHEAANA
jgi:hypothetical protein